MRYVCSLILVLILSMTAFGQGRGMMPQNPHQPRPNTWVVPTHNGQQGYPRAMMQPRPFDIYLPYEYGHGYRYGWGRGYGYQYRGGF